MNAIVEDALAFTRLDKRQGVPLGEVTLRELLRELCSSDPAIPIRDEHGIAPDAPGIVLAGHGPEPFRGLQNLIENALTQAQDAEVRMVCDGIKCRIDVMDRGAGLAGQDRNELVKPFVRGKDAAAWDRVGARLGLVIVQQIAARCGGTFALLYRAGGGTVARLSLLRR